MTSFSSAPNDENLGWDVTTVNIFASCGKKLDTSLLNDSPFSGVWQSGSPWTIPGCNLVCTSPPTNAHISSIWTIWAIWKAWVAGGRETAKENHNLIPFVLEQGDNQPHAKISPTSGIAGDAFSNIFTQNKLIYSSLKDEKAVKNKKKFSSNSCLFM